MAKIEVEKKNKVDLSRPNLQFFQGDSLDKVYDPETDEMYSVFHVSDHGGKEEYVGVGAKGGPDLYWPELTREEFKMLHPTVFK